MNSFKNAADVREVILASQRAKIEKAIEKTTKSGFDVNIRCYTELMPEITAELVMAGYDVFVHRYNDGTSMTDVSCTIRRENCYGSALVHSALGGNFETEYAAQVEAAIKAAKQKNADQVPAAQE